MSDDLEQIEEGLRHAAAVPEAERGAAWSAYVDRLLEERTRLAVTDAVQFSGQAR